MVINAMMEDHSTQVLQKVDTGLNADSAEFCPYVGQKNVFLCGTYKLQETSNSQNSQPEDDESLLVSHSSPAPQSRLGGVTVFTLSSDDCKPHLHRMSQLDMCGVLDMKWPGSLLNGKSLFGLVDAEGFFQVFDLQNIDSPPVLVTKQKLTESSLGLSLGWDGGIGRESSRAVCSDSAGCLTVFSLDNDTSSVLIKWHAHDYEAWIAAFHDFDSNLVYSGGDDCTLKGWDVRDTTKPTFVSKRHTMGVCSIQSHPFNEHIYATGSYDEELLIWDRRQQKRPLSAVRLAGGVWRIKWDPFSGRYILSATMYNGTHIVQWDSGAESLPILAHHNEHNLAYGADWCRLNSDLTPIELNLPVEDERACQDWSFLVATCSFYDHSLHLWQWKPGGK